MSIVFVSCADDKLIAGFDLDLASGSLRQVSRTPVPGSDGPSPGSLPLAVSPDQRYLYAALRSAPFPVLTFAIEPGGTLRHAGTAALADSMCYLSTDPAGTSLLSASYGGSKVAVSTITDGIAGETAQVVATPPKAHSIRLDPEARFAYVACLGGDVILAQRFDGAALDPTPNPAARTRAGAGPRHLAFARHNPRLYCVNELDASVNAYARDPATGTLRELQSLPLLAEPCTGPMAAADIHLTPDERFLYVSERTTSTLAGFRVDPATGHLTRLGTIPCEPTPRGFAISGEGRFLLCAGMASGTIGVYAIDAGTGALTRTSVTPAGKGANWVEILPPE